jgi:hypothetical protein
VGNLHAIFFELTFLDSQGFSAVLDIKTAAIQSYPDKSL